MRNDAIFKRAYNRVLTLVAGRAPGSEFDSEHALARELSVSRTTVRKIIDALMAAGILEANEDASRIIRRHPNPSELFADNETELAQETVERGIMELIQHEEIGPGQQINITEIARRLSVSPSVVREYLSHFTQVGLIARQSNGSWVFRGFDRAFARELSDVREMFELRAAEVFGDLPLDHPAWEKLDEIEADHRDFIRNFDERKREFPSLDREFHTLINSVVENRFVDNFSYVRSFVFHYHYQWNPVDEDARNRTALSEHMDYIKALRSRDRTSIRAAVLGHLRTARLTLLASMKTGKA